MLAFRTAIFLLLLASIASFVLYGVTGQARFKSYGLKILKWTLLAAFGFFAVLVLERI